jgi:ferric-dicitrate binding protein FerR (iron transport regulator)
VKEKEQRLEELFKLYARGKATLSEETELMQLLLDPELTYKKEILLEQAYEHSPEHVMTEDQVESIFSNIIERSQAPYHTSQVVKIQWKRWVMAASVILTLGLASYIFILLNGHKLTTPQTPQIAVRDIKAPEKNRAIITLSNGKTVYLDNAANGKLLQQSGVEIHKLSDGRVEYSGSSQEIIYSTLTNPKGSKIIDIVLADGSHVWLNAGSSVTFPLSFTGNERGVSITGEAYFEVARNESMPFRVNIDGKCEVEVLGTHFNINSYHDEASIKTTLLEGSIKVKELNAQEELLLTPGQQAMYSSSKQMLLNRKPNIDKVMAWKNGYLYFEASDLKEVMRQIARWYDLEIVYQGEVPKRTFAGEIQLDLNLSQILKILETNNVRFTISGRQLLVSE